MKKLDTLSPAPVWEIFELIRMLSAEAIQKAKSGSGIPLSGAEFF